jgi:hypothetical protein
MYRYDTGRNTILWYCRSGQGREAELNFSRFEFSGSTSDTSSLNVQKMKLVALQFLRSSLPGVCQPPVAKFYCRALVPYSLVRYQVCLKI